MNNTHQKCKICGADSLSIGKAKILGAYSVEYFCCVQCGFVQTEDPYWLDKAYESAITRTDVGLVGRNLHQARITQALMELCLKPEGTSVDFGGGYGLFVRLMRDKGYQFFRHD